MSMIITEYKRSIYEMQMSDRRWLANHTRARLSDLLGLDVTPLVTDDAAIELLRLEGQAMLEGREDSDEDQ